MSRLNTFFLQEGYKLTITSDSFGNGYYYTVPNPGEPTSGLTTISPSTSITLGPFNVGKNFNIVINNGNIDTNIEFAYIEVSSDKLSTLTDVELTDLMDEDIIHYDAVLEKWVNAFAVPGSGATALNELSDVAITTPVNKNALLYDNASSKWKNRAIVEADISNLQSYLLNINNETLDDLLDVTIVSGADNQVLALNSGIWVNISLGAVALSNSYNDLSNLPTLYSSSSFNTDFAAKSTTDLAEGTNLYYTTARFDTRLALKTTADLTEGSNLYYTDERVDDRVAVLIQNGTGITWTYNDPSNTLTPAISLSSFSTTNLAEGTNLYYTSARFNTAFAAKSTTDLAEGTNLYYTTARFDTRLALKTTADLTEGSNLYYTDERVDDRVAVLIQNGTGITWTYDDTANTLTPTVTVSGASSSLAYVTIGNTSSLSAERALTGTANQITITDNGANSTVVLSLPQNIATSSSPQFTGIELGNASDTTITRVSAGKIAVEGATLATNGFAIVAALIFGT